MYALDWAHGKNNVPHKDERLTHSHGRNMYILHIQTRKLRGIHTEDKTCWHTRHIHKHGRKDTFTITEDKHTITNTGEQTHPQTQKQGHIHKHGRQGMFTNTGEKAYSQNTEDKTHSQTRGTGHIHKTQKQGYIHRHGSQGIFTNTCCLNKTHVAFACFMSFLYVKSPLYTQKRSPFAHRKMCIGVVPDS